VTNQCTSQGCTQQFHGVVGVLLGNGDGTFQPVVKYSGANHTSGVAVADVNGDGKLDVLETDLGSGAGVLLGNGDGTFQQRVGYDTGGYTSTALVIADVDRDGKLDLLAANENPGTVAVLLGNGDGTFQTAVIQTVSDPRSLAVADLNGDGRLDLIVGTTDGNLTPLVGVMVNNTKSATSTSLASSLNPSTYGQKVTWTATVTSSGSIMPTGKVRFTWSGYTIGSATLNSSGVATLTRSNLNANTYPLTAVYAGDAANLGSTSTVVNQVVLQTTSSAKLTSSPNPSTQGQAVTFTAKISSPTVVPTGPVTFTAGKTVLGTAQLSSGKAKFTISTLAVGSTKVTATYYGNSNISKSSASVTQAVQ